MGLCRRLLKTSKACSAYFIRILKIQLLSRNSNKQHEYKLQGNISHSYKTTEYSSSQGLHVTLKGPADREDFKSSKGSVQFIFPLEWKHLSNPQCTHDFQKERVQLLWWCKVLKKMWAEWGSHLWVQCEVESRTAGAQQSETEITLQRVRMTPCWRGTVLLSCCLMGESIQLLQIKLTSSEFREETPQKL